MIWIDGEEINLVDTCCQTEACGVFGGLLVGAGCLEYWFAPAKSWWHSLGPQVHALIFVGLSTIIGTLDTIFDWIIVVDWYSQGLWKIASCLLASILISGCVFTNSALFDNASGTAYATSAKIIKWRIPFLIPFCLGLRNIILSSMVIFQSTIEPEVYFQFHLGRSFEIFIEAAPGGALQLYEMIVSETYDNYFSLNFISIVLSTLSIAFGTEEAVGKSLPLVDRVSLYLFSATDFVFRVSSISFFLKQFGDMEFFLLPAIALYEVVPWLISMQSMKIKGRDMLWFSFAGAISSTCVAGAHLVFPEFEHVRTNFHTYFTIRFCISSILVGLTMTKDSSLSFRATSITTGIISFGISWRIRALLKKHGKEICINREVLLKKTDLYKNSALMWAVSGGNESIVATLIAAGASVDLQNTYKQTALMLAVTGENESIAATLIEAGASVDLQNNKGDTALILSLINGHESIAATLIAAGTSVDLQNNDSITALILASCDGNESIVADLIQARASVDLQNHEGEPALMLALRNGHESIAATLIEAGASVDLQNE